MILLSYIRRDITQFVSQAFLKIERIIFLYAWYIDFTDSPLLSQSQFGIADKVRNLRRSLPTNDDSSLAFVLLLLHSIPRWQFNDCDFISYSGLGSPWTTYTRCRLSCKSKLHNIFPLNRFCNYWNIVTRHEFDLFVRTTELIRGSCSICPIGG